MIQLGLFAIDPPTGLTCAFGQPWPGDHVTPSGCPSCQAEIERLCAEFKAAVARGEYDEQGYTPNERKAQAKRKAAA